MKLNVNICSRNLVLRNCHSCRGVSARSQPSGYLSYRSKRWYPSFSCTPILFRNFELFDGILSSQIPRYSWLRYPRIPHSFTISLSLQLTQSSTNFMITEQTSKIYRASSGFCGANGATEHTSENLSRSPNTRVGL